jgi:excisionase family DNA binding protein
LNTDSRLLYTPEHAAAQLDIGRTHIYGLIARGELRSVKVGRNRRIPAAALQEYVAKLVNSSTEQRAS